MFDKLRKLLEGGVAEVNPFDGGKTYQSVVNNRTPLQQDAVQQQQLQARQFNTARPQQAPQQNFTDKLRDILDANSQADKFRRAKEGQALDYRRQQQDIGVKRPAMNVGSQLFGNAARFANTAGAALGEIQDTGAIYGANLTDAVTGGNQTSALLAEVDKRQKERYDPQKGIFGAGTWFDNQDDFRKTTADPVSLVVNKALPGTVGAAFEAGSMGAGQVAPKLAVVGAKQFVAQGAKAAAARAAEGVIADAASQKFERDKYSPEQSAIAAVTSAGLPIVARGAGKVAGRLVDAAGNAIGRKAVPRSVAEIAQEVATARQPAIANNAPRTRVAPDGTSLPPRSASQIAQELADSKARAIDPNVQARRAMMNTPNDGLAHVTTPGSALGILDDGKIRANPIGEQGGAKGVSMGTNYTGRNGETLNWADQFAEPGQPKVKINIDRTKLNAKQLLQNDMELTHTGDVPLSAIKSIETDNPRVAAEYRAKGVPVIDTNAKQPRATLQTVPKDPLEALKAEARKYKSAEEFVKAQGEPLYHGSPNHEVIRKDGFKTNPNGNNLLGEGVYLTRHRSKAENYSYPMDLADRTTITQEGRSAGVVDAYIPKGTKIFQPESRAELKNLTTKDLQNKGYGGVEVNGETVIFDSAKIKTKEQLTDLYNQATKPKAYYQNVPKSYTEPKKTVDLDTLKADLDKTREKVRLADKKLSDEFRSKSKNMTDEQKSALMKEYQAKFESMNVRKQQKSIESSIEGLKKSETPDTKTTSEVKRLVKESYSQNDYDPASKGYFIDLSSDNIKGVTPLKGIDDYGDTMYVSTNAGVSSVRIQDWSESGQGFRVSNGNGNEIARFNTDAEAREFARKALTIENEAKRQGKRVILSGSKVENRATAEVKPTTFEKNTGIKAPTKPKAVELSPSDTKLLKEASAPIKNVTARDRAEMKFIDSQESGVTLPKAPTLKSAPRPKTAFEQNTGVVAPTRAKATIQEPVVKAGEQPKAPVLEQATPGEIKISSAAESSKVGAKQRLKDGREQLVNRFAPVEDLVSKIEKETGTPLRPSKNPLSYVRQYLGGGGIANAKIDDELTPIIKQTKQFDGLREYLVAKRMNELADRGMSKRADDVLEGINKKYGAEVGNFEKIAKELYAYQNRQLDELVDVGVLTREAADNIRAKNQYYVPFNRVMPELESFAGTTPANAIGRNGNPIKAIHGSDKDIIDPIESMIRNTYDIQATVQKQKVMRSLYELAPDEFRIPAKDSMNKNRVGMFLDGKKTMLETSEPLARALNSMAEEQMNYAVKLMSIPAKMLRSGATSLNVAFALPNVLRDQLSAAVNSKYGGVPMYDFVSGLASVINKDDAYKKWIMSGADQASFFAQDRTTLQRGVKDITGGAAYKVGKLVKSPLELFRIIGQFSEEGSRVGVYKRALKGATKEFGNLEDATLAAAKESREATIDFARRGSKMKAANALIPFLNARLQGTLKLANSFRERPVQTGAVGMAIAGLPAAALYLHNSQYPEYNEIPDYVRRENFIIMTGNKNTPFIKIPKGEVGKIFGNPVESFLAQMSSEDPEWKSTVGTLVDSFLPVGSVEDPGKFVTDLMPTAASVPLQMTANFDTFRGLPIVSQWQKDLPPEQQYSNYNTETGKKIGAALGVSPAMLEFGIGGVTGGLGRQALQLADMATGNKVPTQDLPVISRFAGEQKDLSKSAGEVYDQLDKDKQKTARDNYKLKQAIKSGDLSGIEGMDKTKANRLVRSVKEDEIKKTLNPTEKALWGMSKEDLEGYEGKYGKEASKVLELKNSLNTSSKEAKTNKEKYEKAFEDFNDPDNGYSRVEKVKKREELKRLTVQKDYDEDTTMLHGMSKEDVWGFLSTYEDGKAMADKLLALDDALTAAGVQDKNKFRDKYGNITIKPKEKSSGGSKAKTVKGQAEAVSSERKLRALLANTNNKASYRKPATQSAKVGLKKFAVKSAGLTSKKGA